MIISINPSRNEWSDLTKRPVLQQQDLQEVVKEVFMAIIKDGDEAVRAYTAKFDNAQLERLSASADEVAFSGSKISDELKSAIKLAAKNVEKFHAAQKPEIVRVETAPGVSCWQAVMTTFSLGEVRLYFGIINYASQNK